MKKEISPELYNYNKYPGPVFARVGDKVVSEGIELNILSDHKNAFDQTVFGQRFSALLLKFDYIVGDWGNDQLRLKGFYADDKTVRSDLKIGRLDDYLTEYCNFGCAYFVLGNPAPQDLPEEPEDKPRRRRNRSNRKKSTANEYTIRPAATTRDSQQNKQNKQKRRRSKKPRQETTPREFVIRKKGE